ncbi:hypothetical protein H5410_027027 [Solanum commersonii]|uniref:6-phosphogluconate dehydrogenase NADP-binding domain-containing protein n=1 Tax=Solanum commersonii TaxID=4109 RepID=A0A9J5Z0S5_SOLCO|nr:hypothetical protein H5410_027027 [Solanum commersonii]
MEIQWWKRSESFSAADDLPTSIGFLGLGIMGNPMAQNLIKAGCDVTVWNRTKRKCEPIISLGAKYKSSLEEVAASCDVTFAMLANPESAADAACGKYGAAKGMEDNQSYDEDESGDDSASVNDSGSAMTLIA